jgi:hypothetical protein
MIADYGADRSLAPWIDPTDQFPAAGVETGKLFLIFLSTPPTLNLTKIETID